MTPLRIQMKNGPLLSSARMWDQRDRYLREKTPSGNEGVIMHCQSGAWTMAQSPTCENLSRLTMASANKGWAVCDHDNILHYQNGSLSLYQGS